MIWAAAVVHQVRHDAHRARWWLVAATTIAVAASLEASIGTGTWSAWIPSGVLLRVAIGLGAVAIVLREAPARPDGFLVGKPVPASVRTASVLVLVIIGLLGPATVGTWVTEMALGVPWSAAAARTGGAAGRAVLAVLPAMALAAFSRGFGGVLWRGIALMAAAGVLSAYLAWDSPPLSPATWRAGTITTVAVLALCLVQAYRRRWSRGFGTALTVLATLGFITLSLRRPTDPVPRDASAAPPGMSLVLDSASFGVEDPAVNAGLVGLSLTPLRVWGRVAGAPPGALVELDSVQVTFHREDGRAVTQDAPTAFAGWESAAAEDAYRWKGPKPPAARRDSIVLYLWGSAMGQAASDHAARRPGARLIRAVVTGRLRMLRPLTVILPLGEPARWASSGVRLSARTVRDSTGAQVAVTTREIDGWVVKPRMAGSILSLSASASGVGASHSDTWGTAERFAHAVSADGREAVWLPSVSVRRNLTSLLSGRSFTRVVHSLVPVQGSGLEADDAWFSGARLHLRRWSDGGTSTVRAEVTRIAVPLPASSPATAGAGRM